MRMTFIPPQANHTAARAQVYNIAIFSLGDFTLQLQEPFDGGCTARREMPRCHSKQRGQKSLG